MLAAGPGEALADLADQVGVELRVLAAGADEALGDLAGHRRGKRTGGGDPDRHLLLGLVVDRRAFGAIELALEADPVLGPQFVDQRDRLAQPVAPFLGARPFDAARRHLVQRLAGADAEHDASRKHRSERAEHLRDDRRVIAESRRQHAGADDHPSACVAPSAPSQASADGACPSVCFHGWKWSLTKTEFEPDLLGQAREVEQFARSELFGRRLVSELQQRLLL